MKCKHCKSERILSVSAKCSDMCFVRYGGLEGDGYVPSGLGIGGGGDDLDLNICMDCGFNTPDMRVAYPVSEAKIKKALKDM